MKNMTEIEQDRINVQKFRSNPAQSWSLVQGPISKGIEQGIEAAERKYTTRLSDEDKSDLISTSMEKALKALMSGSWQGKASLKSWAYRISHNAMVDALRKQNKNPLHLAVPLEKKDTKSNPDHIVHHIDEQQISERPRTPEEELIRQQSSQKTSKLRSLVESWSEPERTLAMALLSGQVHSLTAAAKMVGKQGYTMYTAKAKMLLKARLQEYSDLHY